MSRSTISGRVALGRSSCGGTGTGLSLSFGIQRIHGGYVDAGLVALAGSVTLVVLVDVELAGHSDLSSLGVHSPGSLVFNMVGRPGGAAEVDGFFSAHIEVDCYVNVHDLSLLPVLSLNVADGGIFCHISHDGD